MFISLHTADQAYFVS